MCPPGTVFQGAVAKHRGHPGQREARAAFASKMPVTRVSLGVGHPARAPSARTSPGRRSSRERGHVADTGFHWRPVFGNRAAPSWSDRSPDSGIRSPPCTDRPASRGLRKGGRDSCGPCDGKGDTG